MIESLQNEELERNFLSSVVKLDNFSEVSEIIKEEHFTSDAHRNILKAIKNLDSVNRELSLVFVGEELRKLDPDSLNTLKLVGAEEATSDIKITAMELIEWHNKRELYRLSIKIQEELREKKPSSLITKSIDDTTVRLDVSTGSRAKNYRTREEKLKDEPSIPMFATGVSFIDDYLQGGITAGQLILVMGDPEAGKTILSTQIIHNVSAGFPVLFFPFEFTVRDYINNNTKRKRVLNKDNIWLVDEGYDLSDVSREIKIFAKKGGRFVVIDSQMRITNSDNRGTAEQSESEKFSTLAKLAHHLELIIILIAQQGKEDTKGGTHTPMGTKKGAHESNQIWYIHKLKPKYEDGSDIDINAHKRLLEVSKNKQNGRHFKTDINLNPVTLEFVRKYNKSPIEVEFEGKVDIPVIFE
ncbi:DnaB-like helicase N-terminal domain-containing protein [Aliarcobacter butzleri]|uniref:DnaB-like helicase N-terminal domain-containing protein n=1 Tax=Aliarcobacter butzleri TaxID=28197 RepID=UPI001587E3F3|nr:DnaB-like helicase N-terminal domain-containing protein [Aliarcobacter butzleri]NUW28979.1 hypothetical protein [Aliarcobacter butzleri]